MTRRATLFVCMLAGLASAARAQMVPLPFVLRDDMGSTWDVQNDGSIGDGGGDLYDGGGHLFINNNLQYFANNGQAVLNAAANEIILPPMQWGGMTVSRRVAVIRSLNCCRFIEVFDNPTPQAARVSVRCHFNLGGSVQQALPLADARRGKQPVGYAIQDNNRSLAMIGAARGSKILPQFQYQIHNDNVNLSYTIDVPARQSVAVAHFQLRGQTSQQVIRAWEETREREFLKDLPKELRKKIVNWPVGDYLPHDLEILRGDAQDIVELRGMDRYRGTVKLKTIRLQTLFGPLELPASKVICLFNSGVYRPMQLVVTVDGDVFGGRMDEKTVELQMGWGQVTHIPMSQVTRIGFSRRPGDPEELNLENKTVAYLRDGQRVRIRPPQDPLSMATPLGTLRVPPSAVSSVVFQDDDTTVPDVRLSDGSRISALASSAWMDLFAPGAGPAGRALRLPTNCILRIVLRPEAEVERFAPTMALANGDQLVGAITGTLSVQTPFDTLHVEGPQIKRMSRVTGGKGGDQDVQITLWDDSQVSGRLNESHVTCALRCGMNLPVPIGLIDVYTQPLPQPSDRVIGEIRQIARSLDSDDFYAREDAQRKILSIGPPAMSVLRQMRARASLEAIGRMDMMLHHLERELEGVSPESPLMTDMNGGVFPMHMRRGCFVQ